MIKFNGGKNRAYAIAAAPCGLTFSFIDLATSYAPTVAKITEINTMEKSIITALMTLVLGCGTRTADNTTLINPKHEMIQDTNSNTTTALDIEPEYFNTFFERFTTDSIFQVARVKFPWPMLTWDFGADAPVKQLINETEWKFSSFYYEDGFATRQEDAYTQEARNYGDTVKLEIRGVGNGIHMNYEFANDDGKWFMVLGRDYSN